MSPNIIYRY